jgi:hypothetical protein
MAILRARNSISKRTELHGHCSVHLQTLVPKLQFGNALVWEELGNEEIPAIRKRDLTQAQSGLRIEI